MSEADDEVVTVDAPFRSLTSVRALEGFLVSVIWAGGQRDVVDLAPNILAFALYEPLRSNRALFETVHVVNTTVIAWGDDDAMDMHGAEIERLASETMDAVDFDAFLREMDLTWTAAAALLGISRRMVGYYAKGHHIPRYIALACAQLRWQRANAAA